MAKRLSEAFVLERISAKDGGCVHYVIVETATSGTEAQTKAMKTAEQNPGRIFVPACLWPPIMAQEVRKVTFLNPDNPNDDVTEDVSEDDTSAPEAAKPADKPSDPAPAPATKAPAAAPAAKAPAPAATPAPKAAPAPAVSAPAAAPAAAPAPAAAKAPVPAPKPAAPKPAAAPAAAPAASKSAPAPKSAPKADEKKGDGYTELFGNNAQETAEPEGFVNADDKADDKDQPAAQQTSDVPNLF